jgi:non-homologous end joining protein Ku
VRSVLIRAHGKGLIAHMLNFDYEVRPPEVAFRGVTAGKADEEMLDLALHIIQQKKGRFDPTRFDDRYEADWATGFRTRIERRDGFDRPFRPCRKRSKACRSSALMTRSGDMPLFRAIAALHRVEEAISSVE